MRWHDVCFRLYIRNQWNYSDVGTCRVRVRTIILTTVGTMSHHITGSGEVCFWSGWGCLNDDGWEYRTWRTCMIRRTGSEGYWDPHQWWLDEGCLTESQCSRCVRVDSLSSSKITIGESSPCVSSSTPSIVIISYLVIQKREIPNSKSWRGSFLHDQLHQSVVLLWCHEGVVLSW